jgi:hypothetical protein
VKPHLFGDVRPSGHRHVYLHVGVNSHPKAHALKHPKYAFPVQVVGLVVCYSGHHVLERYEVEDANLLFCQRESLRTVEPVIEN